MDTDAPQSFKDPTIVDTESAVDESSVSDQLIIYKAPNGRDITGSSSVSTSLTEGDYVVNASSYIDCNIPTMSPDSEHSGSSICSATESTQESSNWSTVSQEPEQAAHTDSNTNVHSACRWYRTPDSIDLQTYTAPEPSFLMDNIQNLQNEFSSYHSTSARNLKNSNPGKRGFDSFPLVLPHLFPKHMFDTTAETDEVVQQPPCMANDVVHRPVNEAINKARKGNIDSGGKPPYTYASMIIMTIHLSDKKALTIGKIRTGLQKMFPHFYMEQNRKWKHSVSNTLSGTKYFSNSYDCILGKTWRVNYGHVHFEMFRAKNITCEGRDYMSYLHDELRVEPVVPRRAPPLSLPPKTCFRDNSPLQMDVSCSRNDCAPTPTPSVTSIASEASMAPSNLLKRKRHETDPLTIQPVERTVTVRPTPKEASSATTLPPATTLLKPQISNDQVNREAVTSSPNMNQSEWHGHHPGYTYYDYYGYGAPYNYATTQYEHSVPHIWMNQQQPARANHIDLATKYWWNSQSLPKAAYASADLHYTNKADDYWQYQAQSMGYFAAHAHSTPYVSAHAQSMIHPHATQMLSQAEPLNLTKVE